MSGKPRLGTTDRERAMAAAYKSGKTLAEIGAEHGGLSRQRIEQILKRRFGIRACDGGQTVATKRNRINRAVVKDEKSLQRWGCTFAQYAMLRNMVKPTRAFAMQRRNARDRGIAWEFNLWQWWTIWQQSGRWDQRGRGNLYMMCRKGDLGPYSPDNIVIERGNVNSSEGNKKSGLPIGVTQHKNSKRFRAMRQLDGKKVRLGLFETPELAHAAYLAADPYQQQVAA